MDTDTRLRKTNRLVTAFGKTLCVAEWSRRFGIDHATLTARLNRGEAPESAVKRPKSGRSNRLAVGIADTIPTDRPVIVPDPRSPRPTTQWDLDWVALHGAPVASDSRAVPEAGVLVIRTREWLYERDKALPGRPLKFTLAEVTFMRDQYWFGHKTQTQLAGQFGAHSNVIWRVVNFKVQWYA